MRLFIEFSNIQNNSEIKLPLQYNYLLQGLIYHLLDPEFAKFLHDRGFEGGGRVFKLFTFSRLLGEYRIEGQEIRFKDKMQLIISSPVEQFCHSLLNGFLSKKVVQLSLDKLKVESIRVEKPEVAGNYLKVNILSPVVSYSTLLKPNGQKYTCYFQPGENEFNRIMAENLRKKYEAYFNDKAPEGEIAVKCLKPPRLHVLEYKGSVIKGYSGLLELKGPRRLLQMGLDVGFGSKNSMGFGCGEMI